MIFLHESDGTTALMLQKLLTVGEHATKITINYRMTHIGKYCQKHLKIVIKFVRRYSAKDGETTILWSSNLCIAHPKALFCGITKKRCLKISKDKLRLRRKEVEEKKMSAYTQKYFKRLSPQVLSFRYSGDEVRMLKLFQTQL